MRSCYFLVILLQHPPPQKKKINLQPCIPKQTKPIRPYLLKKPLNLYASQISTLLYVINQSIVRRGKNNSHLKKHFYNVE
jgi:hypothetical protein